MAEPNRHKTNATTITGDLYQDVERTARKAHNQIARLSKRQPYIRSRYFKSSEIFIKPFWEHLMQKHFNDRKRRLRYYNHAIELLRHTTYAPDSRQNPADKHEILHRFYGITKNGEKYIVQVKYNSRSGWHTFMSVFPESKWKIPQWGAL